MRFQDGRPRELARVQQVEEVDRGRELEDAFMWPTVKRAEMGMKRPDL
jgi:hypothetical protein